MGPPPKEVSRRRAGAGSSVPPAHRSRAKPTPKGPSGSAVVHRGQEVLANELVQLQIVQMPACADLRCMHEVGWRSDARRSASTTKSAPRALSPLQLIIHRGHQPRPARFFHAQTVPIRRISDEPNPFSNGTSAFVGALLCRCHIRGSQDTHISAVSAYATRRSSRLILRQRAAISADLGQCGCGASEQLRHVGGNRVEAYGRDGAGL